MLKDTYDAVVSGCANLLQSATFELRKDKFAPAVDDFDFGGGGDDDDDLGGGVL